MKKKILIVSIFAALMLLSTPVISSMQVKETESSPVSNCELCACNAGGLKAFICGYFMGIALTIAGYITGDNDLDEEELEKLTNTLAIILGIMALLRCGKEFFPDVTNIEGINPTENIEIDLISESTSNGYSFTAIFPLDQDIIDQLRNNLKEEYSEDADITFTYNFDFGDGNTETIENVKDISYTTTHTYKNKGRYTVKASITMTISGPDESLSITEDTQETIQLSKAISLGFLFRFPLLARLLQYI